MSSICLLDTEQSTYTHNNPNNLKLFAVEQHQLKKKRKEKETVIIMENDNETNTWCYPKKDISVHAIIYFTQIIIMYVVIIWSLVNITLGKEDCGVWTNLLSSCLGYLLPSPTLKPKKYI